MPRRFLSIAVALALLAPACGPRIDLTTGLQILDVSTGWFDLGLVDGKNKLVPSLTLRLKNVSSESLPALQLNALFRRIGETQEMGSGFKRVTGSDGLDAGATTDPLIIRSELGYTGTESRLDMLKNRNFIDVKVEVFAKYGSIQWTRVGEYPVSRELIIP
jgi:hypothetical protein